MNKTSQKLLNLLYEDSMTKFKDLGEQLGYTRQSIAKLLRKINDINKEKKFNYTIIENPNIQNSRFFYIEIKTNPNEPEILDKLENISRIRALDGIIGLNSLMVKFFVRNNHEFNSIINEMDNIISKTSFQHYRIIDCLKTYKESGMIFETNEEIMNLDEKDFNILDVLAEFEKKFSIKNITKKMNSIFTNSNYANIRRRVKNLKELGIIRSFSIKLSPNFIPKSDYSFKFYLQIKPKDFSEYDNLALLELSKMDEIVELHRTGQEYGLLAVVRTRNLEEYKNFIENLYNPVININQGRIQDSITTLVIDEKKAATFKPYQN